LALLQMLFHISIPKAANEPLQVQQVTPLLCTHAKPREADGAQDTPDETCLPILSFHSGCKERKLAQQSRISREVKLVTSRQCGTWCREIPRTWGHALQQQAQLSSPPGRRK
jgi:hypothetical protein